MSWVLEERHTLDIVSEGGVRCVGGVEGQGSVHAGMTLLYMRGGKGIEQKAERWHIIRNNSDVDLSIGRVGQYREQRLALGCLGGESGPATCQLLASHSLNL